MNYAQIRKYDVANGVGIRTTLFVSGCHFNCKGCFNKDYQNFQYGEVFTDLKMQEFIDLGKKPQISGYSILGGEPLDQLGDNQLLKLVKTIKETTQKSIWMWTGYVYEELNEQQKQIIQYVDVLIDGQFKEEQKNLKLLFRGSENQRMIDVQKTKNAGKIILWERE